MFSFCSEPASILSKSFGQILPKCCVVLTLLIVIYFNYFDILLFKIKFY